MDENHLHIRDVTFLRLGMVFIIDSGSNTWNYQVFKEVTWWLYDALWVFPFSSFLWVTERIYRVARATPELLTKATGREKCFPEHSCLFALGSTSWWERLEPWDGFSRSWAIGCHFSLSLELFLVVQDLKLYLYILPMYIVQTSTQTRWFLSSQFADFLQELGCLPQSCKI